jgi:hypothetical protein
MVPPFASQPGRSDYLPIASVILDARARPRSRTGTVGACQRRDIEDLVSNRAVAAWMTAICFSRGSHCGLGHGARPGARPLDLFDRAGDDIRARIKVVAMHRPNEAGLPWSAFSPPGRRPFTTIADDETYGAFLQAPSPPLLA